MQCKPVIFSGNQLLGLVNPKMACKKIIMMSTDQLKLNDLKDLREAFILEHSLDLYPSFKKLYILQFLCLIVIVL